MKRFDVAIHIKTVNADEAITALTNLIQDIKVKGLFNQTLNIEQTRVGYLEVVNLHE
jgi:hypothetical protein